MTALSSTHPPSSKLEDNAKLWSAREVAIPRGISSMFQVFSGSAQNSEIWDVEGKRYIDFAAGIAVVNTGHNNPRVMRAVADQLQNFSHTCFQVTPYETYVRLCERLNEIAPGTSVKKTILLTTGVEAVENAIKIARAHRQCPGVISFTGAFHGRTMMGMALTGKVVPYKTGFGPYPPEVYHLPFPIVYHGVSVEQSLAALEALFHADIEPDRVAAIILEPVQGEGGFYVAPPEFLIRLREICDAYGIVLIADEIQTGFGRTGKMFACEHAGIEPDVMTMAKSLAGGFPLSAVTGKAEIMDAPAPGGLGGTYGGSPVACAAAHAVLDEITEQDLLARANKIGDAIKERLRNLSEAREFADYIGDIRGPGAMVAVELIRESNPDAPNPELAKQIVSRACELGLIVLSCGVRGNVIRFLAPLTASDEIVKEGLDLFEQAFRDCCV